MNRPEPVTQVKRRRDLALSVIVNQVPYIEFLGVRFDRHGDELTATMGFHEDLIGNPILPALHGGATAAFLEITAIIGLSWSTLWDDIEAERLDVEAVQNGAWSCQKRLILPLTTSALVCREMPMRGRASTVRGGAMRQCMLRLGKTIEIASLLRHLDIS